MLYEEREPYRDLKEIYLYIFAWIKKLKLYKLTKIGM